MAELGLGTWALGGTGWSDDPDPRTLDRAFESGITFFDTAPTYGAAEAMLGRFISDKRDRVRIATKFGPHDDPGKSLERSLDALATDHVDLFQLHELSEEPARGLEKAMELQEQGKVRAIGICNAPLNNLTTLVEQFELDAYQDQYNLFDRDCEAAKIPLCASKGLSFLAYRPLASGLLGSGRSEFSDKDHRNRIYWFRGSELERRRRAVESLVDLATEHDLTLPALALGWVLERPGVTHVLMGARTPEQVEANVAVLDRPLSASVIEQIDRIVMKAFRTPTAPPTTREAARSWGPREKHIVDKLDGRHTFEEIAASWNDPHKPLIAAQVKVFADSLAEKGLVEFDE